MKKELLYIFTCLYCFLSSILIVAQITVKGKVTDAETGEGVPFANVYFNETFEGVTTNFEGQYIIKSINPTDTVMVSYMRYITKKKGINKSIKVQNLNFQLASSSTKLEEIVVKAGENPAFKIMRKVVDNKKINDKRNLKAYEYEAYTKIEIDVDNLSEKFRAKKALRPITKIIDDLEMIAGEDGTPMLPVFFSESISDYYVNNNPKKTKEIVKASKVTGIGMDDGSFLTQIIGPTFQEYNFYKNWLTILDKSFISPIASSWKNYYHYYLIDTLSIDGNVCFRMDIEPKRPEDLAFIGSIYIDTLTFALKQTDLTVGQGANLNYVEKIKIQQQSVKTDGGAWIPKRNRIIVDIAELNENWAGMLAKFYTSNDSIVVNKKRNIDFFEEEIEIVENVLVEDENFWQQKRHDTLSASEQKVFAVVDSMRNIPLVKTYVDIAYFVVNGHQRIGKHFELGPYVTSYTLNDIEGHRFRLGVRSTLDFSKKVLISGYGAYGTLDNEWKYKGGVRYVPQKKPWTEMGASYGKDIEQLGLMGSQFDENGLFLAFSAWGTMKQPFMLTTGEAYFQKDIKKGLSQRVEVRNRIFQPRYNFAYLFTHDNGLVEELTDINTSEVTLTTRYAHQERFLYLDNDRISLGTKKWPIFQGIYTLGMSNVLNSQFDYQKAEFEISQKIRLGSFGNTSYTGRMGKVFGTLPYPLLNTHLGNETPFYNSKSFNLMNYLEFVTDQYMTLKFAHHFEGQLLNRIPLMKKLKWRALANADILYGTVSQANQDLIPKFDENGDPIETFQQIQGYKPYVEIGYGIENILKVIRIEMFHRLTYYKNPGANRWGVKVALQFKL